MVTITIEEQKQFFKNFRCEVLTSKEQNRTAIMDFEATEDGKSLEVYLKNKAWSDDLQGETRVFLVKDLDDNIALFFSVKCGLLYEQYVYDKLDKVERDFVDSIIDAKKMSDYETLEAYYEYGSTEFEDIDKLFKAADKRIDIKNENERLKDDRNTLKVSACYSAVEIHHFCKNNKYVIDEMIKIPIGFGLFWEQIVPHIIKITGLIGCKYLYLFAADNTETGDVKKLVKYYKSALKFSDVEDVNVIKPEYDKNCYGLLQEISDLKENKSAVWETFSDI